MFLYLRKIDYFSAFYLSQPDAAGNVRPHCYLFRWPSLALRPYIDSVEIISYLFYLNKPKYQLFYQKRMMLTLLQKKSTAIQKALTANASRPKTIAFDAPGIVRGNNIQMKI